MFNKNIFLVIFLLIITSNIQASPEDTCVTDPVRRIVNETSLTVPEADMTYELVNKYTIKGLKLLQDIYKRPSLDLKIDNTKSISSQLDSFESYDIYNQIGATEASQYSAIRSQSMPSLPIASISLESPRISHKSPKNRISGFFKKPSIGNLLTPSESIESKTPSPQLKVKPKKRFSGLFATFLESDEKKYDESFRRKYLKAIVYLMWGLNYIAEKQGDPISDSFSYTLLDKDHCIYNFLIKYCEMVNPEIFNGSSNSNPYAYNRDPAKGLSSHHLKNSPHSQYGIDVRFFPEQSSIPHFPPLNRNTHLLFGRLEFPKDENGQRDFVQKTFLKLESVGLGTAMDKVKHGINYIEHMRNSYNTVPSNFLDSKRTEEFITPFLKEPYEAVLRLLGEVCVPKITIREIYKDLPRIEQFVCSQLKSCKEDVELRKKLNTLKVNYKNILECFDTQYPDKYHDQRVGNEVIIDMKNVIENSLLDQYLKDFSSKHL